MLHRTLAANIAAPENTGKGAKRDMNEENQQDHRPAAAPLPIGEQLRAARQAKGLTTEQVAAETRIAQRYIEDIESGKFDDLPGRTYSMGFARTIAKVVGLDQNDVARLVRHELDAVGTEEQRRPTFEPGDPARAPSRGLVWFSILAVLLLLIGLFFAARLVFSPAAELPSLAEREDAQKAAAAQAARQERQAAAAPIDTQGEVVFTATDAAWVRFYDAQGNRLKEGEMAKGETFTIPADAQGPQLITGRPDLLTITIGGREVARLSEDVVTVSDVPVDAASLLARDAPAQEPQPAPSASASPAAQPANR